jgi:hypothetical protein
MYKTVHDKRIKRLKCSKADLSSHIIFELMLVCKIKTHTRKDDIVGFETCRLCSQPKCVVN